MLEWPLPLSCGAQVIETAARDGWGQSEMAKALGVRSSGFRYLLTKAREKLKEKLAARGLTLRELFGGDVEPRGILDPEEK